MKSIAFIAAACLTLASAAHAVVAPPFVLGSAVDPGGAALTLDLTTYAACPAPNMIWLAQSTVGTDIINKEPKDGSSSPSNTYTSNNAVFSGPNIYGVGWTSNGGDKNGVHRNSGLPIGAHIIFYYKRTDVAKQAVAVCAARAAIYSAEGNMGPGFAGASNQPSIAPVPVKRFGTIAFIMTVVAGGNGDAWNESCGYTTLASVSDGTNVLHVAYIIIGDQLPATLNQTPPYCARNSINRSWIANDMPYRLQPCHLTTGGAGSC